MPRRLLPDAVLLLLAIAAVALVLASVLLHELVGAADGLAPLGAGAVAGPPAP